MPFWNTAEVQLLRRHGSQCNATTIAGMVGRSYGAVKAAAKRHGVKTQGGTWPLRTVDRCRRLRAEGVGVAEISRRTGVPRGTLKHWLYGGVRAA